MTTDEWFERLRAELGGGAAAPTDGEVAALLDLARVAAHTSERWAAPVSTFLLGVATAGLDPDARAERVRAITVALEPDADA